MFKFSKKQLTVGLMLLSVISHASDYSSDSSESLDTYLVRTSGGPTTSKHSRLRGFTKLAFSGKNKFLTILCVIAFVCAIIALFVPMTWVDAQAGKMIFGDQGASMWLRLAVTLSCLTFCIGTLTVALCRRKTREGMDEEEYLAYRQQPEQKKKTNKLLLGFYLALFAIAILVGSCGWDGNADNVMFHFAWAMPFVVGCFGLFHVYYRWNHTVNAENIGVIESDAGISSHHDGSHSKGRNEITRRDSFSPVINELSKSIPDEKCEEPKARKLHRMNAIEDSGTHSTSIRSDNEYILCKQEDVNLCNGGVKEDTQSESAPDQNIGDDKSPTDRHPLEQMVPFQTPINYKNDSKEYQRLTMPCQARGYAHVSDVPDPRDPAFKQFYETKEKQRCSGWASTI